MTDEKTRILIADDQELFALGLRVVIETSAPSMEVVGVARNGRVALEMVESMHPDIVLMDVRMPEMDGVEATRILRERYPDLRILILTTFDDDEYVQRSLRYGAVGYLLKDRPADEIVAAIRMLQKGILQIDPAVSSKILAYSDAGGEGGVEPAPPLDTLTNRECDVLAEMVETMRITQIAENLCIAEQTVRNHISNIYSKLGIHDRLELVKHIRSIRRFLALRVTRE